MFHAQHYNLAPIKRAMMALCVLSLFGGLLTPVTQDCSADPAPQPPDLYISPYDILFEVTGSFTGAAVQGSLVKIIVSVHNAGPGDFPPANVSFFCDTAFLGTTPVSSYGIASFIWDTTFVQTGNQTIRIEVNSSIGDANLTNNCADTKFNVTAHLPTLMFHLLTLSQMANVTESWPAKLVYSGEFQVLDINGFIVTVSLTSMVDTGWASFCSLDTGSINDSNVHNVSIMVFVPEMACADVHGTLTVTAIARVGNIEIATISEQAFIHVRPYYRLMMESDMSYKEISPGSQVFLTFKIYNIGNTYDSFNLMIVNLNDLVEEKWCVTLASYHVERVPRNEYRVVRITAQSPIEWTMWKARPTVITIKATSVMAQSEGSIVTQSFPLYVFEKGSNPSYYNWSTIRDVTVLLAIVFIALAWRWRLKRRKKQVPEKPGDSETP